MSIKELLFYTARREPPPTTQREAAFLHAAKVALKPKKNGDSHPLCTLNFKGSLEYFPLPFPGSGSPDKPACCHMLPGISGLCQQTLLGYRGREPSFPVGSEFHTGNCLWTPQSSHCLIHKTPRKTKTHTHYKGKWRVRVRKFKCYMLCCLFLS